MGILHLPKYYVASKCGPNLGQFSLKYTKRGNLKVILLIFRAANVGALEKKLERRLCTVLKLCASVGAKLPKNYRDKLYTQSDNNAFARHNYDIKSFQVTNRLYSR